MTFPDLPGCRADGATPEEAFHQAEDALKAWIKTAQEFGDPIPKPFFKQVVDNGECGLLNRFTQP